MIPSTEYQLGQAIQDCFPAGALKDAHRAGQICGCRWWYIYGFQEHLDAVVLVVHRCAWDLTPLENPPGDLLPIYRVIHDCLMVTLIIYNRTGSVYCSNIIIHVFYV